MKLNLVREPRGKDDTLVLACEGNMSRVDLDRDVFREACGPNCYERRVLVNMERVQGVDTSGITWLLGLVERFKRDNGQVVFYMVPPIVTQVLDFMRLTESLPVAASEQAAAALFDGTGSKS
jgi:anti-anti-sigma factor